MELSPLFLSLGSITRVVGLAATLVILYRLGVVIHRLFFHPLAKFPGPKANAISHFPWLVQDKLQGTFSKGMLGMHEKYGPVVRITPNHLAVDGSIGWQGAFASRGSRPEFAKTVEFYGLKERIGILPALKEDHRRQRRLMAHAFSTTALQEQEVHVKFYVDLFIRQLRDRASQGEIVDIVEWLNFTTFDIIGELAFADPFGSLAAGKYHPWIAMIFAGIKANSVGIFLNHFGILEPLFALGIGKKLREKNEEHTKLSAAKAEKRMANGIDEARKDFMTYILRHNTDGKGMTHREILRNARSFIVAGSETTATALSGLFFHLGMYPEPYQKLVEEIRTTFAEEDDITIQSTMSCQYLNACLEETLRIYPPVGTTPPRISPGDYIDGQYIPEGTQVIIHQWATHHSPKNFTNPDEFVPERWFAPTHPQYDPRYANDNKACFKPFSFGPRDCIGKNLAYAEMRLLTARLLWNFDVQLEQGQQDWAAKQRVFALYEKSPLNIRLTPVVR